ncbi:hypothetical protein, partial [Pseudomonas helleri]|uniref:hypothetical protein n=1 Tax=Pseudomonas helleri TaxID=1608996 RepID=UPI003FD01643
VLEKTLSIPLQQTIDKPCETPNHHWTPPPRSPCSCSLQLAACSLQLAACSLQLAACSLQLAACSQNSRHKKTTAQVVFLYPGVQSP